ncbi:MULTISPECIES: sensor histidine kinase [Streptomyces]|uniref:histidine kinase n=2 Tax=Streptomyces TaxID=1883 RepID=A0ABU2RJU6_9ACTN|nr:MULTISPECIES: histidine kinase [unclassified Streptomyces]MBK3594448.1 two-component sensor histidine kinase [Streptomyces sp. MBT51]MDT0429127.1 histidine kinase [Streptomyces sp. DSM 41770]
MDDRWPRWGADAGLVVLTFLPPLLSQPYVDTSGPAWASLTAYEAVGVVALLLRRRLPATAFVVVFAALLAALVGSAGAGAKLSPLVFLPLAVLLYNLGNHCASWRRTVSAVLAGVVLGLAGLWLNRMTTDSGDFQGGLDVLAALAPMPLAWAMGFAARTRQALLAAAERRAADARRAQVLEATQATQRERARIAGEMHDVVAHSLTLLVVHAETLRARGGELPDWARTQVDGLAAAGRQSSGELRDLLRMLRDPADAVPLQPVPGLGELKALLDSHRAAGGTVELTTGGAPESVPGPVQLAGYRIVQEALVNARRHAPGAPVRVSVDGDAGELRCEIVNGRAARRGTPGAGVGLGLVSMKERVDALGGELVAGPTGAGGFRVMATMRWEPADV